MSNIIKNNWLIISAIILSIIVGAIGGLNQTSLRKLIAYSSIRNNGWILIAILIRDTIWLIYFIVYIIITIVITISIYRYINYHINQLISINDSTIKKLLLLTNIISIRGLPPILGFIPKWLIIQSAITENEFILIGIIVIITLITVYYYLRIIFSTILLSPIEQKWNNKTPIKTIKIIILINSISIIGLTIITIIIRIY